MASSPNTPNRSPDGRLRLLLLLAGEDHPKACTGRRLLARGLVTEVTPGRPPRPAPVLLDPRASTPLSAEDRGPASNGGVLGVDCSWNRLAERGGYPDLAPWLGRLPCRRRLPFLLAGNPQHYGRLGELNTAEAFAAAVFVLGDPPHARQLLEGFAGGAAFLELNRAPLGSYATSSTAIAVEAEERSYF